MMMNDWRLYALGSAFFASLTAIFAKIGVNNLPSNLATLLRTLVVVVFLLAIVTWRGEWASPFLERRASLFLVLSGLCTGASWLCYFHALKIGPASQVAPVDKLSVVLTMFMAFVFLGEMVSWRVVIGGLLIAGGSLIIAL